MSTTGIPTVHTARDVPALRDHLVQQWAPGGFHHQLHQAAAEEGQLPPDYDHGSMFTANRPKGEIPWSEAGDVYARWEHLALAAGSLWYVGNEMMELLIGAALNMPDDVKVDELVWPSSSGLVVFASPWLGCDAQTDGQTAQVHAMVWGHSHLPPIRGNPDGVKAITIASYRYMDEGNLSAHELAQLEERAREQDRVLMPKPGWKVWVPLGRSDWPVEDTIGQNPWELDDLAHRSFVEDRKVLAALFVLIAQEGIAQRTVEAPDRPARRRAQRAGVDPDTLAVQVVTLRRPRSERTGEHEDGEHEHARYSHRWIVDGHWRWQPYGPGRSLRRLTYIAPHVKGPADAPLVVRERVHALVR